MTLICALWEDTAGVDTTRAIRATKHRPQGMGGECGGNEHFVERLAKLQRLMRGGGGIREDFDDGRCLGHPVGTLLEGTKRLAKKTMGVQ